MPSETRDLQFLQISELQIPRRSATRNDNIYVYGYVYGKAKPKTGSLTSY